MKKNNVENEICYHGRVELIVGDDRTEIHNEGLIGVSEIFTRAVLGYPVDLQRPYYIDFTDLSGNSVLFEPVEIRAASFDTIKQGNISTDEDKYILGWKYPVFDALVLAENILDLGVGERYIYMYSKNKTPIARVKINVISETEGSEIEGVPTLVLRSGNNILVRWSMYLSNRLREDE